MWTQGRVRAGASFPGGAELSYRCCRLGLEREGGAAPGRGPETEGDAS